MKQLRGVAIGAGYFSQFHYDAWQRIPEIQLAAVCDRDLEKARQAGNRFNIPQVYSDYRQMLEAEQPDFLDVITPPSTHLEICIEAARRGTAMVCQKPLTPTLADAESLVQETERAGVRLMVHENFRFQPWHREIKRLIETGAVGDRLHSLSFQTRTGDGWGADAYLNRQPYFREMPRLLVYETGVHFIDTFRFLAGDIRRVTAWLRRLNTVIQGEDCGLLVFEFANGALGTWDANRFNEPNYEDPRYTFGKFLVEGNGGSLRLYPDGRLTRQPLGEKEEEVVYTHEKRGFGGDCCYNALRHFIDRLFDGQPFETNGRDYLNTLKVQEAVYRSAENRMTIEI